MSSKCRFLLLISDHLGARAYNRYSIGCVGISREMVAFLNEVGNKLSLVSTLEKPAKTR
jgi:hypothetical protein